MPQGSEYNSQTKTSATLGLMLAVGLLHNLHNPNQTIHTAFGVQHPSKPGESFTWP